MAGRLKIYDDSQWKYAGAGLAGATGADGIQGQTGVQGIQGNTGVQGVQGQTGVAGETGVAGVAGETGVAGVAGETGVAGVAGETGVAGVAGETGVAGVAGETGIQGIAGVYAACYYADQLDSPNSTDWAVNASAPASADASNNAIVIRKFDAAVEEGVGFSLSVPAGKTNAVFTYKSRADVQPLTVQNIVPTFYTRSIPDNGAVEVWSEAHDASALAFPATTTLYQYDTDTISLATLDMTAATLTQLEMTRTAQGTGSDLTGDWNLAELGVSFT